MRFLSSLGNSRLAAQAHSASMATEAAHRRRAWNSKALT